MSPIDLSKFEQLKATGDLPSPRGVALHIIRLTQQDNVSFAEMARVIKADPAFVGRLMKTSNGVNAVGRRPVASVQDALLVLGLPTVRNLALGFSLLSAYDHGSCPNFDYAGFWSASLACGIATQVITTRTRAAMPEEAFCAGLLSRVGDLALATLFPAEYAQVLTRHAGNRDLVLAELEQETFALNHAELAAAMLGDWGLPKIFVDAALHHEDPDRSGFPEGSRPLVVTHTIGLARHIASICTAPEAGRSVMMARLFLLGSRLSLSAEALTEICDKVVADWLEWSKLLKLKAEPLPSFEEMAKAPSHPPRVLGVPGGAHATGKPHLRVLVVDDDATMRAMLRAVLEGHGYEVLEAKNGQQGLEVALDKQPHLMVVDWMMPEMDGITLTRALRKTRAGRGIYILILTSLEDDERLIEAFESGVDDFVSKPLKPRVLAARLTAGLRIISLHQEIEHDREEIRHFATELAITNRRLQEVALTDSLTGFPNRRYAMERIQQEWAAALRSRRPMSCMVIDLDDFKRINDQYGHDVGDIFLRQTALALKRGLRAQDVIARTGGDEFLVICPDTTLDQALSVAERVRAAVAELLVKAGMLTLKSSVSVGVAQRLPGMPEVHTLIKTADQGLYVAKEKGRNCVASIQSAR